MKNWQPSPHSFHGRISVALVLGRVQAGYGRCCVFKHGNRLAEAGEQSSTFRSVFRNLLLLETDIANHTEQTCDFTGHSIHDLPLEPEHYQPPEVPHCLFQWFLPPLIIIWVHSPLTLYLKMKKIYRYLLLFSGSGALPPSLSSSPHLPLCGGIQVLSQSMISRGPVSHAYWLLS